MTFIFAISLVVAVLLVGLVIAAILFLKIQFQRTYLYRLAASINRFPGRLRLKKQDPIAWQKAERAQQRISEFEAAGFVPLGGFAVDELPKARIFALRHPENGLVGVVNETVELGTWSDVYLFPADGTQPVLASGMLKPAHLYFLPGDPQIHKPDATVPELVKTVQAAAGPNATVRAVTADGFAPLFEHAFADATDTRLLATPDDREIRRLLKERRQLCGGEISDKEFSRIKALLPQVIELELRLACRAQFLRETTLPAVEWQHATQRLLVIHDRTPIRRLTGDLSQGVYLTAEIKRRLGKVTPGGSPRADFASFNENSRPGCVIRNWVK